MESLAQSHRHGVFELRAAHLEDIGELRSLLFEGFDQLLQVLDQLQMRSVHTQVNSRRVGVVGRLRTVHVVVGRAVLVFAVLMAHDLQRAVGDHFVGVHVGRRTGTALDHIHGECVVVLAVHDLAAGLCDRIELLVGEQPQLVIGFRSSQLGNGESLDEEGILVQMEFADSKVLDTPQGLDTVKYVGRQLYAAEQVALRTHFLIICHNTYNL